MGRTYWESASQTATRTKVAQGTDGSPLYVRNNAGNFIFAHSNSGTVVSFKAFLSEFNMKIVYAQTEEGENDEGGTVEKTMSSGPEITYSVGLSLVAHSLTEAKLNLARINEVNKMYSQIANPDGISDTLTIESMDHFIVQYSNLISANYKKKINYFDKETLLTQGVPGYITSFDFTINKEIGMFEEDGKLFPKLIDFKFELLMSQRLYRINYLKTYGKSFYYLYLPFKTDGSVWSHDKITYSSGDLAGSKNSDIGTFPFGLDISKEPISKYPPSGMGKDGSVDYSQSKQANIFFASNRVKKRFISFKPFFESLSLKLGYKEKTKSKDFTMGSVELERSGKLSKTQDLSLSFQCVAHSVEEARQNMIKVQSLLRLLIGIVPDGGDKAVPEIAGTPLAPTGIFNYSISAKGDSSQNIIFIKFSNIIAKKIGYVSNKDDIENFGRAFFVNSYGLDVLEEMGMFEHNGMFYFKVMKLTFDLSEVISVERPYEAPLDNKSKETLHIWKKNQNGKLKTNKKFDQDLFVGEDFDDLILTYHKGKVP